MSNDYTLPSKTEGQPKVMTIAGDKMLLEEGDYIDFGHWLSPEWCEAYGHAVAAPLLARIAELEAELAEAQSLASDERTEMNAENSHLRAEVEALRAKIDRAEVSYGNMLRADDKRPDGTTEYTRGWGDCLRAIAARKGEGSEG